MSSPIYSINNGDDDDDGNDDDDNNNNNTWCQFSVFLENLCFALINI